MLSSYRALLARHGAAWLAFACALAWLSYTGYSLAIILAVRAAAHSFAVAGTAVAAFSIGSGAAAPARGRLIDTRGPRALAFLTTVHGLAFGTLVFACATRRGPAVLVATSGLAGALAPPLIATARASWPEVAGPGLAGTAHALNASLADAAQLLSPAVTGAIAAAFSPVAALAGLLAGATTAAGIIGRGGRRRAQQERRREAHQLWGGLRESAGLRTAATCSIGIGVWVGALEVTVTAAAARAGSAALGPVLLSASALGSILVSIWSGNRRVPRPPAWRYTVGSCIAAAALLPTVVAHSLPVLAVSIAVAGAGFGLLGVASFELLDHVVSTNRAVEAFTWLTTGQATGTAVGAAAAGHLARVHPTTDLYLVAGAATAVAVLAVARRGTLEMHNE